MDKYELLQRIHQVIGQYRLVDARGRVELWLHPKDARKAGETALRSLGVPYRTDKRLSRGVPVIKPMGKIHV